MAVRKSTSTKGHAAPVACRALPRKHYRCLIPADVARYTDEIELRTTAFDEFDMRHILRCAFGKWAAEEATVEEVRTC